MANLLHYGLASPATLLREGALSAVADALRLHASGGGSAEFISTAVAAAGNLARGAGAPPRDELRVLAATSGIIDALDGLRCSLSINAGSSIVTLRDWFANLVST